MFYVGVSSVLCRGFKCFYVGVCVFGSRGARRRGSVAAVAEEQGDEVQRVSKATSLSASW